MLHFHDKIRINVSIFCTFFFSLIPDQVQLLRYTYSFFSWCFFCLKHPFSPFPCTYSYSSSETHSKQDFHKQPLPEHSGWGVWPAHPYFLTALCIWAWRGTYHSIINYSPCLGLPMHWEPLQKMSSLLLDPWHLEQGLTWELIEGITDLTMDTTWPPLR